MLGPECSKVKVTRVGTDGGVEIDSLIILYKFHKTIPRKLHVWNMEIVFKMAFIW